MTAVSKRPESEYDEHPSFVVARANRISSSPPGVSLFDSEIRHQHFVRLTVDRATRKRELHRDWIFGGKTLIEIDMSMAQWGALVSSFGDGSGVPVTLNFLTGEGSIESPPYEPRMEQSTREVEEAAGELVADIEKARAAVQAAFDRNAGKKEMKELLWHLECMVNNAKDNARYTAQTFTEHVENVVTKARYDIEAQVQMAAEHGLDAGASVAGILDVASEEK